MQASLQILDCRFQIADFQDCNFLQIGNLKSEIAGFSFIKPGRMAKVLQRGDHFILHQPKRVGRGSARRIPCLARLQGSAGVKIKGEEFSVCGDAAEKKADNSV
jgi:hypothetical protein